MLAVHLCSFLEAEECLSVGIYCSLYKSWFITFDNQYEPWKLQSDFEDNYKLLPDQSRNSFPSNDGPAMLDSHILEHALFSNDDFINSWS